MTKETYIITYNRINFAGKRRTLRKRKYEYRHAVNAVRFYDAYYVDTVIGWSITRASDGVVLAERKS